LSGASPVEAWFGDGFARLHPLLQALHRDGGRLEGVVRFRTGRGLAGVIGRRAMWRLGIDPGTPEQRLVVDIRHVDGALRWARRFGSGSEAVSWFRPIGRWPDGCWEERAGPLRLRLAVDTEGGGWSWRQIGCRLWALPLPAWLAPGVDAGKRIDAGHYRFDVAIRLPLLGEILAWGGHLRMAC
jgi:hypothetical protein